MADTKNPYQQALRYMGFTGTFGGGRGEGGKFLDAEPGRRQLADQYINDINSGRGLPPDFDRGGVAPVGVLEPFNDWQKQGLTGLATYAPQTFDQGFIRSGKQYLNNAGQQTTQGMRELTDADFSSGVARYMNPYMQNVVDASLRDIDRDEAIRRTSLTASRGPGSRSFGDSSGAIQLSELARNTMDAKAKTGSGLRYQGYTDAANNTLNQFNQERGRNLSAGAQFGNLSDLAYRGDDAYFRNFGNMRSNAERTYKNQLTAGTAIQDQNQRMLDMVRGETDRLYGFDDANLNSLAKYLGMFPGSQTQNTYLPSGANTGQLVAGGLQTGAHVLSDYFKNNPWGSNSTAPVNIVPSGLSQPTQIYGTGGIY